MYLHRVFHWRVSHASLLLIINLFLLGGVSRLTASDLTLTNVQYSSGLLSFQHATRSDSYYVLYYRSNLYAVEEPNALRLGTGGDLTWGKFLSGAQGAATVQGYFRVREVPTASPLDLDGDGMDDIFERGYPGVLNPLDPLDAQKDPDRDGDSNLKEYLCRTSPTNHFNDPMPMTWSKVVNRGISRDVLADAWHAGRLTDVIANTPAGILVATECGGVWSITHTGGAIALSHDWDRPEMQSLTQGPDGPGHFFAGGTGLYETDVNTAAPLLNWHAINQPIDQIRQIVVSPGLRRIVIAGYSRIYWADIPPANQMPRNYFWKSARLDHPTETSPIPWGAYSSLALGPDNTVIAGAHYRAFNGASEEAVGLWRGLWMPDPSFPGTEHLVFSRATVNGADFRRMQRTSVVTCEANRNIAYAIASDVQANMLGAGLVEQLVYTIVRSVDGGQTWNPCGQVFEEAPAGYQFNGPPGNQGASRNQCLAVHPANPDLVAFGWRRGPFVSTNGGATWRADAMVWDPQRPNDPQFRTAHQHGDLDAVYFDPFDPSGNTIYIGSDGGIIRTSDRGLTFTSVYNQNLANLDLVNPTGERYWYGTMDAAALGADTLLVSGTQDNGNVYSWLEAFQPDWRNPDQGDGHLMLFLQTGDLLRYHNGNPNTRVAKWNSPGKEFEPDREVSVLPNYPSTNGAYKLDQAVVEKVVTPGAANDFGQLCYAAAGRLNAVLRLHADPNGQNSHWEQLNTVPLDPNEYISGVGTYDGSVLVAGTIRGKLFVVIGGTYGQFLLPAGPPISHPTNIVFHKFAFFNSQTAFVCARDLQTQRGYVLRSYNTGYSWEILTNGLPTEPIFSITADSTSQPPQLFAATDDKVYVSYDAGDTWKIAGTGLPRRPLSSDLRVATDTQGRRHLYLSTIGHSVWRTPLADYGKYATASAKGTSFSGNFILGTFGQIGDFDLLVPRGEFMFHYSRRNDEGGAPWKLNDCLPPFEGTSGGGVFMPSATAVAVSHIQSRLGNPGYPGMLEAVARMKPNSPLITDHWLAHYYYDTVARKWHGPFPIRVNGQLISGVTGDPALIQSTFGVAGNYEVLVPMGNRIAHLWRNNDAPGYPWNRAPDLPCQCGSPPVIGADPLGVAFLESNFRPGPNIPGTFEAVARLRPQFSSGADDYLGYYYFDTVSLQWIGPTPVKTNGVAISGVTGTPALMQSTWGTAGNYEMLVPMGNRVAQFWRNNDAPGYPWSYARDLPPVGGSGGVLAADPVDVAFFQGPYATSGFLPNNFEAVVRLRPRLSLFGETDYLVTYYLDNLSGQWVGPVNLVENGQRVEGVTGF
jgi:hypothetical protein